MHMHTTQIRLPPTQPLRYCGRCQDETMPQSVTHTTSIGASSTHGQLPLPLAVPLWRPVTTTSGRHGLPHCGPFYGQSAAR